MTTDELRESLLAAPKNGYARITKEQKEEMNAYCKHYMAFIDACKTEREATAWAVAEAEKLGYKPFTPGMTANPGDKIYYNNHGSTAIDRRYTEFSSYTVNRLFPFAIFIT